MDLLYFWIFGFEIMFSKSFPPLLALVLFYLTEKPFTEPSTSSVPLLFVSVAKIEQSYQIKDFTDVTALQKGFM